MPATRSVDVEMDASNVRLRTNVLATSDGVLRRWGLLEITLTLTSSAALANAANPFEADLRALIFSVPPPAPPVPAPPPVPPPSSGQCVATCTLHRHCTEYAWYCSGCEMCGALARLVPLEAPVANISGFYDGGGIFRIRWSPSHEGLYRFTTESTTIQVLSNKSGTFAAEAARPGEHGPVRASGHIFVHADGTEHFSVGTTAYSWVHQTAAMRNATLATLAAGAGATFNKIRMLLLPKWYPFYRYEPPSGLYPFATVNNSAVSFDNSTGDLQVAWTWRKPNPEYWRVIDECVSGLHALGVQADLILFHPYDHWGFAGCMDDPADGAASGSNHRFYLRYVLARFAAFSNVWWSLANEYDFMSCHDWNELFLLLANEDPHEHRLRSIHYFRPRSIYDASSSYITHVSMQASVHACACSYSIFRYLTLFTRSL